MSRRFLLAAVVACAAIPLGAASARAEFIVNGGFEAGFANWTVANRTGGSGNWFVQTGTTSPTSGFAVPAPPEGLRAAMTDQGGPGTHVLYQDFFVPLGTTSGTLTFQRFVGNRAGAFINGPQGLNHTGAPNQQARVDIMRVTGDPFSTAPADILQNIFQTNPGNPLVSGYSLVTADVSALLAASGGQTLRLRFAEVDNQLFFQFGIDTVSLNGGVNAVPAPPAAVLVVIGALCVYAHRRLRRAPVAQA